VTDEEIPFGEHIAILILALLVVALISLSGFFYVITHDTDTPATTTTTQELQRS